MTTSYNAIGQSTTLALAPHPPHYHPHVDPLPYNVTQAQLNSFLVIFKSAQKGLQTSMPRNTVTSFLPSSLTLTTGGGRLICKTMRQHVVCESNVPDLSAISI